MESLRAWRQKLRTPVVRNAGYLIASEAVAGTLGLVFWGVAARLFPNDADIGLAAILINGATLLALLSTLGFNVSLVRFIGEPSAPIARMINSSVTIGCAVAILLATLFGMGAGVFLPRLAFLASNPGLLILFAAFTAIWTVSLLFDAALVGLGRAKYVFIRTAVYNLLKIPLPAALVIVVVAPFALFSAWGLALLAANILAALVLLKRVVPDYRLRPDLDRATVRPMVRYSAANHTTNVLAAVPGLLFPLLVATALPPENAAYFYIAWVLANFLFIIPGSIFTSVFAEGSRWRPGLKGNAIDGLFLSLGVLIPAVAAVILAGPLVLGALKSTFASQSAPLLNILAASSFFVAINALYTAYMRVEKRMRPVIGLYAGTTLGALALVFPLTWVVGLPGAGLAFGIAQGTGAAFALSAMVREGVLRQGP